jgi:hypothetical protein
MYQKAFDWHIAPDNPRITPSQAQRWGATKMAGATTASVAGINGGVRFIQSQDYLTPEPLKTFGWSALEVCVDDVFYYTDRAVKAGFTLLNEPVALSGSDKPLPLIAAQLAGINGEVLYITQILDEMPNFELPDVKKESGSIFICVLGASDLEASRKVLEEGFELRRASDRHVAIKVLNKVYDKPLTDTHRLSSLQLNGRNAIEIDQMPAEADAREVKDGLLPPGISIVSVIGQSNQEIFLKLPDGAGLEILPLI